MSKRQKAQKLKGFQDIHGRSMLIKEDLSSKISQKAKLANFVTVETPCLEYTETLLGEGGETDKQIFRFEDNGGRDVALRYDLTVPFARFVSEHHGKLPLPYKRFQIGKAWRAEKPQKGRFREFSQCDFDIVGSDHLSSDIEVVSLLFSIFSDCVKLPFTMRLGYRQVVSAVIAKIYPDLSGEHEERVLINLDKIDKIGSDKVCSLIAEETGTDRTLADQLLKTLVSDENEKIQIAHLRKFLSKDEEALKHLDRLERTLEILALLCQSQHGKLVLDFSLVRGLAYYTGVVFETNLDDFPEFGSVCSGGRYDNLCDRFLKESLPGVGGSFGLDRLVALLAETDYSASEEKQKLMVAVADDSSRTYAFEVLKAVREKEILSEIFLKDQKLSNQFKYASKFGFSFVLTIGEEEKTNKTITLKNMKTKEEFKGLRLEELFSHLS